jgi:hypothetical protein
MFGAHFISRSVIFSGYYGFLHQLNWLPQYTWNQYLQYLSFEFKSCSNSKDPLTRIQNNVSECSDVSTRGLLFQLASTIKIQLIVLVLKSWHHHFLIDCNLVSPVILGAHLSESSAHNLCLGLTIFHKKISKYSRDSFCLGFLKMFILQGSLLTTI